MNILITLLMIYLVIGCLWSCFVLWAITCEKHPARRKHWQNVKPQTLLVVLIIHTLLWPKYIKET